MSLATTAAATRAWSRYVVVHERTNPTGKGTLTHRFLTNSLEEARAHAAKLAGDAKAGSAESVIERRASVTIARRLEPGLELPLVDRSEVAIVEYEKRLVGSRAEMGPKVPTPKRPKGLSLQAAVEEIQQIGRRHDRRAR
jgi:hypothetical protein